MTEYCSCCEKKGKRVELVPCPVDNEIIIWAIAIWPPRVKMQCPDCGTSELKIVRDKLHESFV